MSGFTSTTSDEVTLKKILILIEEMMSQASRDALERINIQLALITGLDLEPGEGEFE